MYSRILVPVDGSEPSRRGLREAVGIAQDYGSELVLLHVVVHAPVTSGDPGATDDGTLRDILDRSRREIVGCAAREAEAAGVAATTCMIDGGAGPASDVVIAQARAVHCELNVMGTHGRRGMRRLALGSDAERVVRQSTVPVLLVKPAPRPANLGAAAAAMPQGT